MTEYLWQYVLKCDPFAVPDDVVDICELNDWDLLITFVDGRKILYDRYTNYYKNILYDNINELSENQEKKEFTYRLRSLMGRNRITQDQLAEMVNTSQVMISRYVRGEVVPNVIMARKIAKAIGCSLDDFFPQQF